MTEQTTPSLTSMMAKEEETYGGRDIVVGGEIITYAAAQAGDVTFHKARKEGWLKAMSWAILRDLSKETVEKNVMEIANEAIKRGVLTILEVNSRLTYLKLPNISENNPRTKIAEQALIESEEIAEQTLKKLAENINILASRIAFRDTAAAITPGQTDNFTQAQLILDPDAGVRDRSELQTAINAYVQTATKAGIDTETAGEEIKQILDTAKLVFKRELANPTASEPALNNKKKPEITDPQIDGTIVQPTPPAKDQSSQLRNLFRLE